MGKTRKGQLLPVAYADGPARAHQYTPVGDDIPMEGRSSVICMQGDRQPFFLGIRMKLATPARI